MPTMSDNFSVPLNGTAKGRFSGQLHEYVQRPSVVSIYIAAAAAGVFATINNGRETLVNDQEVSNINRYPVRPDDLFHRFEARPGDRIVLDYRNGTAGNIITRALVDIEPVA